LGKCQLDWCNGENPRAAAVDTSRELGKRERLDRLMVFFLPAPEQTGTEGAAPPGHPVGVGPGMTHHSPTGPLVELRLVDELLYFRCPTRGYWKLTQLFGQEGREQLTIDEEGVP
jgi:hypothetical protein